jgi:hypothetical protein
MFGQIGIGLSIKGLTSNEQQLQAGQAFLIPAGGWQIACGPYSAIQFLDPISLLWKSLRAAHGNNQVKINSDGGNFRIINASGCAAGAVVTAVGSGYTNGFGTVGVTSSAGGSLWKSIVGGLINTSPTTPSPAGANLTYPPLVFVQPPPTGGIQCTAHATISAGAVNAIVVDNQGGGYTTAPLAFYVADPRDPNNPVFFPSTTTPLTLPGVAIPTGAYINGLPATQSAAFALTGTGTLAGVVCTDPGNPQTAVPTLTVASGAGTATALMNFAASGALFTVVGGGTGYGNAQPFDVRTITGISTATTVNTNPAIEKGITQVRPALISGTSSAGGAVTATGAVAQDNGIGFQLVPLAVVDSGITGAAAPPTVVAAVTTVVGGVTDWFWIMPSDA